MPRINLLAVTSVTFGLGLAASGYLNYYQHQQAAAERTAMKTEITDLRYALKQEGGVAGVKTSATPSPSPSATPKPSPTPEATIPGSTPVKLIELSAQLSAAEPVADLTYSASTSSDGKPVANLTSSSLMAKFPACKPGASSLGQLVRRPHTAKARSTSIRIKTIGEFDYYYVKPTANCGSGAAGRAEVTAARAALFDQILPTLTAL